VSEIKGGSVHPAGEGGREYWSNEETLAAGYRGRTAEDGDVHTAANQRKVLAAELKRQTEANAAIERAAAANTTNRFAE
jgi:hypothetical protein